MELHSRQAKVTWVEGMIQNYFERLEPIRPTLENALRKSYFHDLKDEGNLTSNIKKHIEGRSRFFINTVLPWINSVRALNDLDFIEIGPGTGSTTAPLSFAVRSVRAYDISDKSADIARLRCREMGVSNVDIITEGPNRLLERLRADHVTRKASAVLMFAVLEHMKVDERLATLSACWDVLEEGGILIAGDTPNRLVYRHNHTSRYPFFDMVPDKLMLKYVDEFPNPGFAAAVRSWTANASQAAIENSIDRWGRGVSFHEFELALGGKLEEKVIADGLERQFSRSIPIQQEELTLMRFLNKELPHIPLGFGRASLYLILQKRLNPGKIHRQWDDVLLRNVLTVS